MLIILLYRQRKHEGFAFDLAIFMRIIIPFMETVLYSTTMRRI